MHVANEGRRCRWRVVARAVVAVAVVGLLVSHRSALAAGLSAAAGADLRGVLVTALLTGSTFVFAALSLIGAAGRPLSLGRTALVQLSAVCANRVTPAGIGAMGVNLRYLEDQGASAAQGLAAIGLSGVVTCFVRTVFAVVVVVFLGHAEVSSVVRTPPVATLAVALGLVGAAAVVLARRRDVRTAVVDAVGSVRGLRHEPGRLSMLLVGACGSTFARALSFVTAAHACGVRLPVGSLLVVFLGGSAVSAAAPAAAGLGSVEAAIAAGLTGLGAAATPAMAAAMTFRLVTYWLPVLPSLVALWITRRGAVPAPAPELPALVPAPFALAA